MGATLAQQWRRPFLGSVVTFFVWIYSPEASAQIWVVTQPDGSERFTTRPEAGARLYVRTRFSNSSVAQPRTLSSGAIYTTEIASAATETGLDPGLIRAVIAAESNFDARAVSSKGAQGLMQLMPATARELGVDDVWEPQDNILGGARHLARLMDKYDDVSLALAAYNAGEGTVSRYGGVPPYLETRQYVRRVLGFYRGYRGDGNE